MTLGSKIEYIAASYQSDSVTFSICTWAHDHDTKPTLIRKGPHNLAGPHAGHDADDIHLSLEALGH